MNYFFPWVIDNPCSITTRGFLLTGKVNFALKEVLLKFYLGSFSKKSKVIVMKVKILLLLVFLFLSIGCAHRVEIYQLPPGSDDFLPSEVGILIPAILRSTDIRVNGKGIKPSEEFIRIVLQKVQRTHVFLEVSSAEKSGKTKMREKAVHLELSVDSVIEIHETTNLLKLAANCVLFLFSSALPFKDDFDVTMALKTIRYDGEERYYKSRIKGKDLGVSQRKGRRAVRGTERTDCNAHGRPRPSQEPSARRNVVGRVVPSFQFGRNYGGIV